MTEKPLCGGVPGDAEGGGRVRPVSNDHGRHGGSNDHTEGQMTTTGGPSQACLGHDKDVRLDQVCDGRQKGLVELVSHLHRQRRAFHEADKLQKVGLHAPRPPRART